MIWLSIILFIGVGLGLCIDGEGELKFAGLIVFLLGLVSCQLNVTQGNFSNLKALSEEDNREGAYS